MDFLQISGAALLRILSGNVSIVEVVVLDKVSLAQSFEDCHKVVLTMKTKLQLSWRNTCADQGQQAPTTDDTKYDVLDIYIICYSIVE